MTHPEHESSNNGLLTTGDMARLAGSTLRTIRFYEQTGLLSPVSRSDTGHRLFERAQLQKLRLILDLREAELSISDIKRLFELKGSCTTAEEASQKLSSLLEERIDEMQRKISTLRRLREELTSTLAILSECVDCEESGFPENCGECDVLNQNGLPRALRLLWST